MSDGFRHPVLELTGTRIIEFWRDKEGVFWTFGFPLLLAFILGMAFRSQSQEPPRIGVLEGSPAGVQIGERLRNLGWSCESLSRDQAELQLRRGRLDLLIEIDGLYGETGSIPPISALTFRYDRSRAEGRIAFLEVERVLGAKAGASPPSGREKSDPLPGSRYIDFLIPGLIGLNLMGSGMWGVGFSITMARHNKVLKLLAATPMRRSHYLLSYVLSRLILLVPEVLVLMAASRLLFDVRVRGTWPGLILITLLGAFAFVGLGLLTAIRARTVESISGWMNLVMMPMWVLSGSFFSYERFPELVHPLIRLLPLTAVNDALRLVMVDGMPVYAAGLELLVLTAWCLLTFAAALHLFRWQ